MNAEWGRDQPRILFPSLKSQPTYSYYWCRYPWILCRGPMADVVIYINEGLSLYPLRMHLALIASTHTARYSHFLMEQQHDNTTKQEHSINSTQHDTSPPEGAAFLQDEEAYDHTRWPSTIQDRRSYWPWIVFTCVNLLFTTTLIFRNVFSPHPPCGPIWKTDLLDAHGAIKYEERTYTGALTYDHEKKKMVREANGKTEYFGPPGPEVDAAWRSLLHGKCCRTYDYDTIHIDSGNQGQYPTMTDEEAAPFTPDLTRNPSDNEYHFQYVLIRYIRGNSTLIPLQARYVSFAALH
jgi:hypothetical protein